MEAGYVILSLKPGMKKAFIDDVKGLEAVKEARVVIGIFDAVVRVETESIEELEKVYLNKIDKLDGIVDSRLHIVACPRARK